MHRHPAAYRTPLLVGLSFLLLIALVFNFDSTFSFGFPMSIQTSPATVWHTRAVPHPSRDTFVPSIDNLAFGVLRNAPVEHDGFTVAFFKPDVAVDAMGNILQVASDDWTEINTVVQGATTGGEVPEAGGFRNQWRIKQARTSYPIDWLRVPVTSTSEFKDLSIYGFDGTTTELQTPIHGLTQLPPILLNLFSLVIEGREGYVRGSEDREVVDKVKKVLGI